MVLFGATVEVDATLVRDTLPYPSTKEQGNGIVAAYDERDGPTMKLTLRRSVLERNATFGLLVYGAIADIDGTVIRQTRAQASDSRVGIGIASTPDGNDVPAKLTIRRSTIDANLEAGISIIGSIATIDDCIVRGTGPSKLDEKFGDGVFVWSQLQKDGTVAMGDVSVHRTLVLGNARSGLGAFGARLTLGSSVAACNAFDLDYETATLGTETISAKLIPDGENWCGCKGVLGACQATSTNLEPVGLPSRPKP